MLKNNKKQDGAVLMVTLLILVVMTILGTASMKTTILEEKMAGNYRDGNLAFQATESSLRDAESWLDTQALEPVSNNTGSNRVWNINSMNSGYGSWWASFSETWWTAFAVAYVPTLADVNTAPLNIIEYKKFIPDTLLVGGTGSPQGITYYRVTGKGTGGTDQAKVLLQSVTARRY